MITNEAVVEATHMEAGQVRTILTEAVGMAIVMETGEVTLEPKAEEAIRQIVCDEIQRELARRENESEDR